MIRPHIFQRLSTVALCLLTVGGALGLSACPEPMKGAAAGGSGSASDRNTIGLVDQTNKEGSVLAKMDGLTLTTGEIEQRLNSQSAFVRARFKERDEKLKFVDQQMRVEVLAREAMELGYHKSPDVQDALKKIIVQKLTREKFDSAVRPQEITDEELAAYYEKHRDEYNKAEMVRLAHIVISYGPDDSTKAAALQSATQVATAAKNEKLLGDRKHFKGLVAKHSDDAETKKVGGDLRYLTKAQLTEKYGQEVADAAFGMTDINQVVGPIAGKTGFHILKRTGHRKAIVRTLDQVKNPIRNVLYREKRSENFDKYVDELKKKFNVTVFAKKIDEVQLAKEPARANVPRDPHGGGHGHGLQTPKRPKKGAGKPTK